MHKNSTPSANDEPPVRHASLTKQSNNNNFYNSTYESSYQINSTSPVTNDSPVSHPQTIAFSTDDLAQLETFDEQSIITYMYNRFLANQIYTYIGDILVVSILFSFTSSNNLFVSLGCESISFIAALWQRCNDTLSFKCEKRTTTTYLCSS